MQRLEVCGTTTIVVVRRQRVKWRAAKMRWGVEGAAKNHGIPKSEF